MRRRKGAAPAESNPSAMQRALFTFPPPAALTQPLTQAGISFDALDASERNETGLRARLPGVNALLCTPWIAVGESALANADTLRVVSTCAVGYDNIDIAACHRRGIAVGHTPGVVVEPTADIALGLILAVMRGIVSGDRFVRAGAWLRGEYPLGRDLHGATLGIVGMGAIGTALAKRALACGMKVIYANRNPRPDAPLGVTFTTFDELIANADCVVALVPLSAQTRKMFSRDVFARMKRGAFFVNVGRGGLVDTDALHDALRDGPLAAAGVDVIDPEPFGADHPILALPNFVVTPHIGTSTIETRGAMFSLMLANAIAGLRGEPLPAAVPA
jgi:glyoxylate reductase